MPGGTERKETKPASLVVALNSWFVAVFTALTVAPRMTAPVGSVTVPEIVPVAIPCENAEVARNRQATPASSPSEDCKGRPTHFTQEALSKKSLAVANKFIFNYPHLSCFFRMEKRTDHQTSCGSHARCFPIYALCHFKLISR